MFQLFFMVVLCGIVAGDSQGQSFDYSVYFPMIDKDGLPTWIGPDGGYPLAVVLNPVDPSIGYVGTWGAGVFQSIDGGNTWSPVNSGLGNLYINSLAIDPLNPNVLYAGTYRDKLYKSIDGGQTWFSSSVGIQDAAIVYTIAIDPTNSYTIYIGTRGLSNNGNKPWNGVVYRSIDGGLTWDPKLFNVGGDWFEDWAYSLAVHPNSTNIVYAATHEHGVYRSTNYGNDWQEVNEGIEDESGRAVVVDPSVSAPGIVYYGVWHGSGVYKSINGGGEWTLKDAGLLSARIYSLVVDPIQSMTLYAATFNLGIRKSIDGGQTWYLGGLPDDSVYSVAVHPQDDQRLFAATAGNGLYSSHNQGLSWQPSQDGLRNTWLTGLIVDPVEPRTLYSGLLGGGVWRSSDNGQTWVDLSNGLGSRFIQALYLPPWNNRALYALTDQHGLYMKDLSTGAPWASIGASLPQAGLPRPAYGPEHPFAPRESLDQQYSWNDWLLDSNSGLPVEASLLAVDSSVTSPGVMYLGTVDCGVYKTYDGGLSWGYSGLISQTVWSLAVDPQDSNIVYAATDEPGGVKRTMLGGGEWEDIPLGGLAVYDLALSPARSGVLYAGSSSGVYQYLAGGGWTQLGLDGLAVTAVAEHPTRAGAIFAGTTDGLYISPNAGLTWLSGPAELKGITIQTISFVRDNSRVVYIGTTTHGSLRFVLGF